MNLSIIACKQETNRFIQISQTVKAILRTTLIAILIVAVVSCTSNKPSERQLGDDSATRHYYTLANGLPVFIYYDKSLPATTATATVASGSYNDPAEYPGLHHLLEHLVLFGDKNKNDSLPLYANSIGGHANAHTSPYTTTFEFAVANQSSSTALQILAESLKPREYSHTAIHSETKAVHHEFVYDTSRDRKKEHSVFIDVNNLTGNDYFGFQGNESTLLHKGVSPLAQALKDLQLQLYSTKNIALAVFTGEDVEIIKSAIASSFGEIPEGIEKRRYPGKRFAETGGGKRITTHLKSRKNQIMVEFAIPSELFRRGDITWSDIEFLVDTIGISKKGGLIEKLVSEKLIDNFNTDYAPYPIDFDGHLRLYITIAEDAQDRKDEIAAYLFAYFEYLKDVYLDQYFSSERTNKYAASFTSDGSIIFRTNVVARALNHLSINQIESLLADKEYSKSGITKLLNLLSPDSVRIWDFRSVPDPKNTQVTEWFEQKYSVSSSPVLSGKNFENNVRKFSKEFTRQPEEDVSSDIFDHSIESPTNIQTSIPSDTWLVHNTVQKENSGALLATINSPFGKRNQKETAIMSLFYAYFRSAIPDSIRLSNEDVRVVLNEESNLSFYLQGRSSNIQAILLSLFKHFKEMELSKEQTEHIKSTVLNKLETADHPTLFEILFSDAFDTTLDRETMIKEVEKLSLSDLEAARDSISETAYLTLFAVGKFSPDEIQTLSDRLSEKVTSGRNARKSQQSAYIYFPDKKQTGLSVMDIETESAESVVLLTDILYDGSSSLKANLDVLNAFYYHKITERFRRELGVSYVAESKVFEHRGVIALTTHITSGTLEAELLLDEINAFREEFSKHIESISQEEIDHVSGQLASNHSITAVTDEQILEKYRYSFSIGELELYEKHTLDQLTALQNVTPASINETFQKLLDSESNGRRVVIKSIGKADSGQNQ